MFMEKEKRQSETKVVNDDSFEMVAFDAKKKESVK